MLLALSVNRDSRLTPCQVVQVAAVPVAGGGGGGGGTPTTLTIHYRRSAGDTSGWTLHTWDAAVETAWAAGLAPARSDDFGVVYEVPLRANSGSVGYIFHKGDEKDHGGADQRVTLQPGANVIWRVQGDPATYLSNPLGAAVAYGVVYAHLGVSERDALLAFGYNRLTGIVSAGLRLVAIGQQQGQTLLTQTLRRLPDAVERILSMGDAPLRSFNPILDIQQMNHRYVYSRLFRS